MTNAIRSITFLLIALVLPVASSALAGFAGSDLVLPAAGRVSGANGSEFYTTVWVSNPTDRAVDFQMQFLITGTSDANPPTVNDTLAPGQSKTYANIGETVFQRAGVQGAMRFRGSERLLVAARIYNQSPGATLRDSQGLYFAAVPASFAIGDAEQAALLGVNESSDFRYNVVMVEVAGSPLRAHLEIVDPSGATLGSRDFDLRPYEQLLVRASEIVPGGLISDGRVRATVASGAGKLIVAGSLVANGSQDATGFEMSFRDGLLATNLPVVTSLNGLSGALTLAAGPNVAITSNGSALTISSTVTAGPQGPSGATGATGPAGPTGATGSNGPAGPAGATGATGPIGPAGPVGATGAAGSIGPAGPTGATGATGPIGPVGPVGATGGAGSIGPAGPAGATGATGAAGPTGATGATGSIGPAGPAGTTGAAGPIGPAGPMGATGATGATGSTGPAAILNFSDFSSFQGFNVLVPPGAAVSFLLDGTSNGVITHVSSSVFLLPNIGTYLVQFQVPLDGPGRLALELDNVFNPLASVGTGGAAGTTQLVVGMSLVRTTAVNSTIAVVNPTGLAIFILRNSAAQLVITQIQ